MQITAAVAREKGAPLSLETLALEAPRPGEVLVRVVATSVCHTDMVVRDGHLPTPLPVVLGRFIPMLIEMYRRGDFPFDRMVRFYPFSEINAAIRDSETGQSIKPIVRIGWTHP